VSPQKPVDDAWSNESGGLRNVLSPAPAAERRPPPPIEPRAPGDPNRRKSDSQQLPPRPPIPISDSQSMRPSGSGPLPRPSDSQQLPRPSDSQQLRPSDSQQLPRPSDSQQLRLSASALPRARTPSAPPPLPPPPRATTDVPEPDTVLAPVNYAAIVDPPLDIAPVRPRAPSSALEPPPTRIHRADEIVDRPFTPPRVLAVPEIPEPGLVNAARYAYRFGIARWQRRGAIKQLGLEIKQDTEALDQVLGALGRAARGAHVEGRVFSAENSAISAAEDRVASLTQDTAEVEARKAEENSKFGDVERERNEKLVEAERMVDEGQRELQNLEAQRRSLRDKRKELDRRQRAYLKNADDQDRQAGAAPLGDQRQELRRAAEGHRKEAAALEPEKQELDRRVAGLERPINEATARLDAAKAELDAAKRSLADAREGHTHRLAELDAEQKRKAREIGLAEAEISRRLVTLGTLVNLNRIEDPQFTELYLRIDRLRGAITARTTEIEKLTAEREAYDRGMLVRGIVTIGGAFVVLIALIVILRAIL